MRVSEIRYWFTLIEIVVSLSILMIILTIVSLSVLNVNKSIYMAGKETAVFDDLNELLIDKYKLSRYNSGIIISYSSGYDALLLFSQWWKGTVFWVFDTNQKWYDYKLAQSNLTYENKTFWVFELTSWQVLSVLWDIQILKSMKLNNWKIFQNVIVNYMQISPLQSWEIFQIDLEVFLDLPEILVWKLKSEYQIEKENLIKLRINF